MAIMGDFGLLDPRAIADALYGVAPPPAMTPQQALASIPEPTPYPVPSAPTPLAAFLAAFGGSLGAGLTRNPQLYETAVGAIQDRQQRNLAAQMANTQQKNQYQTAMGQGRVNIALDEAQAQRAREARAQTQTGDLTQIGAASKSRDWERQQDLPRDLERIKAQAAQDRATLNYKMQMDTGGLGEGMSKDQLAELNRGLMVLKGIVDENIQVRMNDLGQTIPATWNADQAYEWFMQKSSELRDKIKGVKPAQEVSTPGGMFFTPEQRAAITKRTQELMQSGKTR